ncbi:MAG: small subunit ribosomal protein S16 [Candidatus Saccharimonadales bacterium]|jgi:small subunit ribosomal protein S16
MLTIRMQRTGRKGFATFRVVVQDSRFSPTSGRVVAQLGHYNPHTKESSIDTDRVVEYLKNGAQPSPRVVRLLEAAKVKLPDWVEKTSKDRKSNTRNPEKLRKNQPKEEAPAPAEEPVEAPAEEPAPAEEAPALETPAEEPAAEPAKEEPATEEPATEEPATEEPATEATAEEAAEAPAEEKPTDA